MKKRLIGSLLFGALMVSSSSVFVSCADYDDDINANKAEIVAAQQEIAKLTSNLSDLQNALKQQKADLEGQLNTLQSNFDKKITEVKGELDAAIAQKADQSYVDGKVAELNNLLNQQASEISAIKAKIASIETAMANLEKLIATKADQTALDAAIQTLTAAINGKVDKETYNEAVARISALETLLNSLKSDIETLRADKAALADVNSKVEVINKDIEALKEALKDKVSTEAFNSLKAVVDGLQTTLANVQATFQAALDKKADQATVDALKADVQAKIDELNNQLKNYVTTETFNAAVSRLEALITTLQNSKADKAEVTALQATLVTVQAAIADLQNNKADKEAVNAALESLRKEVEALVASKADKTEIVRLDNLIEKLQALVDTKASQADVDAKEAALQALIAALEANKADRTELEAAKKDLADALAAAVSTINDEIAAKYAEVSGRIDKAFEDLTDIRSQIVTILAQLAATNGEVERVEAKFDQLIADLQDADKTLDGKIEKLQGIVDGHLEAYKIAMAALNEQIVALQLFQKEQEETVIPGIKEDLKNASEALQEKINQEIADRTEAVTKLTETINGVQTDIATKYAELKDLIAKGDATAEEKIGKLDERVKVLEGQFQQIDKKIADGIDAHLSTLKVYIDRLLKSIVLRPDTYYGGIEGVSVYAYDFPVEKNNPEKPNDKWRYFDRTGSTRISDFGQAQYHVNPSNVDLADYTIDFYNWVADVKEPATKEQEVTRSGVAGITPVYKTTKELLEANADNLKNGILTVPFTANTDIIEKRLEQSKATIASLAMTRTSEKGDTVVNSDYAMVVPEYGYGLLIGDNTFPVVNDLYLDQIGYDGGAVNSRNLHRSFSFLALATTSPTHTIKYDGSFDITKVLESRYFPKKEDWESIKDTAVYVSHSDHRAIARWNGTTLNIDEDGDATIARSKVKPLDPLFEQLGLRYDIQLVDYTLGSNKTGETVHLELITDENGHVIAYPRNVTADGKTITGKTANAACVGRQPIVCIMVRNRNNDIVSFAYMKFLITQDVVTPEAKEVDFDIKDIWVNCKETAGRVTWSEIEYHVLDQALEGMSKKDFDLNYVFDYYDETTQQVDVQGATYNKVTRFGIQYASKGGKRINKDNAFGEVDEEWNESAQHVEDATTHIIKWSFTAAQLKAKAEALKAANELEDKGDYYANKKPIVTWVRYAHKQYNPLTDAPRVGQAPDKGAPSIWVKLTIPAGEFHVAKGEMGANKILTFWYALNSKTNATSKADAFEVRINVPVPVPETSATEATIGYSIVDNATPMDIRYDNLLEKAEDPIAQRTNKTYTEFTKNLKDFFIDGKLSATVKMPEKFSSIKGMKLGVEFILPSTTIGNATFNAGTNNGVANSWTVKGYTGATYTLVLNADRTKIQIAAQNSRRLNPYVDLITLNYDYNTKVDDRQITVVNYVNGEYQDDILNYKTHNELGERETFTAYLNIKAINACAPVYWDNMWFNARFLRPLDLEEPKQAVVPDAPNDWHEIDLTDALIVKDWREYYGDRTNSILGRDIKKNIPGVGNVKAFDFAYYQVSLDIHDGNYYTDANLGTSERSDNFTLGEMPRISGAGDANAKNFIKTSSVPNLKLEKISNTKLRYLNNSGVTGGFHVFVPIEMTYVYGYMQIKQTKWVTVGVTPSVEQAMIEE